MRKTPTYFSDKQKLNLVRKICKDYANSAESIVNVCNYNNVAYRTFYDWLYSNTDFAMMYENCKLERAQRYKQELRTAAETSMMKLIQGYTTEETKVTTERQVTGIDEATGENIYGPVVTSITKVTKHYHPNPTMIIFALTNTNAENDPNYLHRNTLEVKATVNNTFDVEKLSAEELEMFVKMSEKMMLDDGSTNK